MHINSKQHKGSIRLFEVPLEGLHACDSIASCCVQKNYPKMTNTNLKFSSVHLWDIYAVNFSRVFVLLCDCCPEVDLKIYEGVFLCCLS